MSRKTLLSSALLGLACLGSGTVAEAQTFSADKYYIIYRNGQTDTHMYENGGGISLSASDNTHRQYWRLVPTGNTDCYYIQNATTGHYVQTSKISLSSAVAWGTEPVEYKIAADNTASAATKGFYYMASTDQGTISNATDGTLGLNCANKSSVVAYYIKTGRGNSYWEIKETAYDYEAPAATEHTALAKKLGVYQLPCGAAGTAYASALTLKGEGVTGEVDYTASAKPSQYFNLLRNYEGSVAPGGEATFSWSVTGAGSATTLQLYTDWDGDGVFGDPTDLTPVSGGTAKLSVPADAKTGKTRLRLRLTDNGMTGAEDDVNGFFYDIPLTVAAASDLQSRTVSVQSCDSTRGTAALAPLSDGAADGSATSLVCQYGQQLRAIASAKGNAVFKGWQIGSQIVSTSATYDFSATQNATLTALFSPNTVTTAIDALPSAKAKASDDRAYDLKGRRIADVKAHHGVYIQGGSKRVRK